MRPWRDVRRSLGAEVRATALALRHPRTPWYAKALAAVVVTYALSPIDLVPDFVPVLGQLDDLVLVPLGVALVWRLVPPAVREECRAQQAGVEVGGGWRRMVAAGAVVAVWTAVVVGVVAAVLAVAT
jgi:uncharacterized membrane protein YkvA (DUF1232 family)